MYDIPSKVIYNLLDPDVKVEKVLRLVNVSRLTKEKDLIIYSNLQNMLRRFNKNLYGLFMGEEILKKHLRIILKLF